MIAKNVGIRRTRGEFVLATNIDVLFDEGLIAYIASDDARYMVGSIVSMDGGITA